MPAIDLARLKTQSARLADNFSDHHAFLHEFNDILEYYTNRTMRGSQIAKRLNLPTYHTPAPVLRKIEYDLAPLAEEFPGKGIILASELWKSGTLESRLLAARLAGMIPPAEAIPLLARLPDWLAQTTDKLVLQAILTDAFSRIRSENPAAFFMILEEWLKSSRPLMQRWSMQALIPLLNDPAFENLPAVLRILRPAILAANSTTQLELQTCFITFERISLTETVFYLRELFSSEDTSKLTRIFQRMLPAFSPEFRSALHDIIQHSSD
jgi:hypothetical protein